MSPITLQQLKWRSHFPLALLTSTVTSVAMIGVLAPLYLPALRSGRGMHSYSVVNCAVADNGRDAWIVYWDYTRHGSTSLEFSLGTLDLDVDDPPFSPCSIPNPRNVVRAAGDRAIVIDEQGGVHRVDFPPSRAAEALPVQLPTGVLDDVACSDDGRYLIAADNQRLTVVDLPENTILWQRRDLAPMCFALHPQAGLMCGLISGEVVQLSLETGEVVRSVLHYGDGLYRLALHPRGHCMACLDWNGTLQLTSLIDGRVLWRREHHGLSALPPEKRPKMYGPVLCFSPDGHDLVTAAREGQWVLGVWDTVSGDRVRTLRGHQEAIIGARFTPDGTLASWSSDGTLRLWSISWGSLKRVVSLYELK